MTAATIKREYPAAFRKIQVDIFTEAQTAKSTALLSISREGMKNIINFSKLKTSDQSTTTDIRNLDV